MSWGWEKLQGRLIMHQTSKGFASERNPETASDCTSFILSRGRAGWCLITRVSCCVQLRELLWIKHLKVLGLFAKVPCGKSRPDVFHAISGT